MENEKNNLYKELTPGQIVSLDQDLNNSSKVKVVKQTPKRLFTTVTVNGSDCWNVMTIRLSEL